MLRAGSDSRGGEKRSRWARLARPRSGLDSPGSGWCAACRCSGSAGRVGSPSGVVPDGVVGEAQQPAVERQVLRVVCCDRARHRQEDILRDVLGVAMPWHEVAQVREHLVGVSHVQVVQRRPVTRLPGGDGALESRRIRVQTESPDDLGTLPVPRRASNRAASRRPGDLVSGVANVKHKRRLKVPKSMCSLCTDACRLIGPV
jgi:hypothetical protein